MFFKLILNLHFLCLKTSTSKTHYFCYYLLTISFWLFYCSQFGNYLEWKELKQLSFYVVYRTGFLKFINMGNKSLEFGRKWKNICISSKLGILELRQLDFDWMHVWYYSRRSFGDYRRRNQWYKCWRNTVDQEYSKQDFICETWSVFKLKGEKN